VRHVVHFIATTILVYPCLERVTTIMSATVIIQVSILSGWTLGTDSFVKCVDFSTNQRTWITFDK